MLKTVISSILKLNRQHKIRRFFSAKQNKNLTETSLFDFDVRIKNPVLWQLIESFQRYGYVRGSSCSQCFSRDLEHIIENLKNVPMDFQNLPKYLQDCKSYEEIISTLSKIYCTDVSAEYLHINSLEEREWFSDRFARRDEYYNIENRIKFEYLKLINRSESFDLFLAKKFQHVKRYSGEGVESIIIFLKEIFSIAAYLKITNIVIAMAHRSRNNVLVTLLNYPPILYFRKMMGFSEFPNFVKFATGDTFSHFFNSMDYVSKTGFPVHISLIPNPSHLEANIPVCAGKVRSKMQTLYEGDYSYKEYSRNGDKVLGIFIHGDASIYGQGIVCESLIMTDSPNFSIGGSIHVVINNKLGFTTETPNGIKNVTDISKVINAPIIHVNAYKVLDVAKAAMLAMDYRNIFRKDIFINIMGHRKWGHNELDDPTITQPIMYSKIASTKSISEEFTKSLIDEQCVLSQDEILKDIKHWETKLNKDFLDAPDHEPHLLTFKAQWADQNILDLDVKSLAVYNTGLDIEKLIEIGKNSVFIPHNFKVHHNVHRVHIQRRLSNLNADKTNNIDWATAESLAVGSILVEGKNCRISGQDVGRGTFSHRHFIFVDQENNKHCVPFNICSWSDSLIKPGNLEVANSILSEEAVLGFEIGMAMDNPNNLYIWEAQFGDFFNGAQILIDTYLGSAETKWMLQNGLVLLLPHGYDGAGPEHSSCRLERFLQLTDSSETQCDSDLINLHVINPTTPAQYFHALRRQLVRPFRRPLVIASPKLLLRSPLAISSLTDFENGTFFHHVIPDSSINSSETINTVLLCSGKHYYTLKTFLETSVTLDDQKRFAIIRIEQLAPFPICEIHQEIVKYKNAKKFIWCQEEPRNMGAWQFINSRIQNLLGINLKYSGRKELATPAVGITNIHKKEIIDILESTFY